MIIEIEQPVTKEKVLETIQKASSGVVKKSLHKHFGKLQPNLDSVDYQKKLRNDLSNLLNLYFKISYLNQR